MKMGTCEWCEMRQTVVTNHSSDRSRAAGFVTFTPRAFALESRRIIRPSTAQETKIVLLTAQE